ncbi:MAG: hypothetical protein ACJA10_000021 [Oleispira sp.]|jgi:hypothetical protein
MLARLQQSQIKKKIMKTNKMLNLIKSTFFNGLLLLSWSLPAIQCSILPFGNRLSLMNFYRENITSVFIVGVTSSVSMIKSIFLLCEF